MAGHTRPWWKLPEFWIMMVPIIFAIGLMITGKDLWEHVKQTSSVTVENVEYSAEDILEVEATAPTCEEVEASDAVQAARAWAEQEAHTLAAATRLNEAAQIAVRLQDTTNGGQRGVGPRKMVTRAETPSEWELQCNPLMGSDPHSGTCLSDTLLSEEQEVDAQHTAPQLDDDLLPMQPIGFTVNLDPNNTPTLHRIGPQP